MYRNSMYRNSMYWNLVPNAKKQNDTRGEKLRNSLKAYARNGCLNKEDLKNVFDSLGAYNPLKQAEEALSVVDKNNDNIIDCTNSEELRSLEHYVLTKGQSVFKYLDVE